MMHKNKITAFAVLTLLVLAMTPLTVLAQGQFQSNSANQIVSVAQRASLKVQALIASVEANHDAATAIQEAGLKDEYDNNVELFNTAVADNLKAAKDALEANEYDVAVDNALEALGIFREV
jgi:1-aminocyclopropane-1-carboxylate deaminase/D-cysteine desulfhydrase-like pyridoxal-dependent ACC family enzyme